MEEAHILSPDDPLQAQTSHSSESESFQDLEDAIAQAWQEVFRREPLGREQNFFELGGNSLLGMDLAELLAERLGLEVPVLAIFQHPTIRELANVIAESR
jgi:hypothetical protein